jgi:thiamine biosynthesis lipoprotein
MSPPVTPAPARARRMEHCMGTVFTVDIRDSGRWDEAMSDVVHWLHHVDGVFSTYRPDSDISRLQRGELAPVDADPDVAVVLDLCARYQAVTGGWFTPHLNGRIDPTGIVKGWAIERASDLLRECGSAHHVVSGGGDMQLAGEAAPGCPWRVGISNPRDGQSVLEVISVRDAAVATSGSAERGAHIVDPFTGRAVDALSSVTVVSSRLTLADAYATAAYAMGEAAAQWLETTDVDAALVVGSQGTRCPVSAWSAMVAPMPQPPSW